MQRFLLLLGVLGLLLLNACGAATPTVAPATVDHVTIQHILIAFDGSLPGQTVGRTQDEAATLAADVLQQAKSGADFDELVKKYTADQVPGIYKLANIGVAPGQDEFSRDGMVKSFGDVAFSLQVGEIGMAEYDKTNSPYGWHIIKRLQ